MTPSGIEPATFRLVAATACPLYVRHKLISFHTFHTYFPIFVKSGEGYDIQKVKNVFVKSVATSRLIPFAILSTALKSTVGQSDIFIFYELPGQEFLGPAGVLK
jgi:hypothetical protein